MAMTFPFFGDPPAPEIRGDDMGRRIHEVHFVFPVDPHPSVGQDADTIKLPVADLELGLMLGNVNV